MKMVKFLKRAWVEVVVGASLIVHFYIMTILASEIHNIDTTNWAVFGTSIVALPWLYLLYSVARGHPGEECLLPQPDLSKYKGSI